MKREWVEKLRESCHAAYNGGHHDEPAHGAFHHGMDTICNVLASASNWQPTEPGSGDPCEKLPYRDCRTPNCIECAEPGSTVREACGELARALREFLGETETLEALMAQYGPPPFSKEEVRKIVETVTFALRQQLKTVRTEPGIGVTGEAAPKPTEYYGPCPKCGVLLGFGHLPEKCIGEASEKK